MSDQYKPPTLIARAEIEKEFLRIKGRISQLINGLQEVVIDLSSLENRLIHGETEDDSDLDYLFHSDALGG
jgi:hypothetical protein